MRQQIHHPHTTERRQATVRRDFRRYLLYFCLGTVVTVSLVVKFVNKKEWCRMAICYKDTWQKPDSRLPCLPKNIQQTHNVSLLFGLSGNADGVLAELEVALKSVFLNCPIHGSLDIHIMADDLGQTALEELLKKIELKEWWAPINIMSYNVQDRIDSWSKRFNPEIKKLLIYRHTFGSYFRLFAHEVLPRTVKHVLYIDSDVIIMANLADLWQYVDKDVIFQWGQGRCAGFVFLNLQRMPEIWPLMDKVVWYDYPAKDLDDQTLLRGIEMLQPNVTGCLPTEWDFSFADSGGWTIKGDLFEKRPEVGMAHFNGIGGRSKGSIYKELSLFKKYPDSWGLFLYYVNLPWTWVRFFGKSVAPGRGHKIRYTRAV